MKVSQVLYFHKSKILLKNQSHHLILAEKPSSALKISRAFKYNTVSRIGKSRFLHLEHESFGHITIAHALGHIYQLKPESQHKFPKFNLVWKPSNDGNSKSFNIKVNNIIGDLQRIKDKVDEVIIATDYDVEGEVIGLNIIRNALGLKDASRMKFSTLTPSDLIYAFETRSKTLNWPTAKAGEARHKIDWFYGINLSEALNAEIRTKNKSETKDNSKVKKQIAGNRLSVGRVQTPTLNLLVKRQREIDEFVPEEFFKLQSKIKYKPVESNKKSGTLTMNHERERIFSQVEAQSLSHKLKDFINENKVKAVPVNKLDISKTSNEPPVPFSLSLLQYEASKKLKMTPSVTLKTAQSLYQKAYISYPRTSSQKIPPSLKPWNIIQNLSKQKQYSEITEKMLKEEKIKPRQGGASDPAHPAIHPTGQFVKNFTSDLEEKLYDLIVKRFLASCYQEPQVIQHRFIEIKINDEKFNTVLSRVVEPGWQCVYQDPTDSKIDNDDFPDVSVGDLVKLGSVGLKKGKTTGPSFYTPASLLREMEVLGLGTKSTRSQNIELLRQRGYAYPRPFRPSPLGEGLMNLLVQADIQEITEIDLTKKTEEQLNNIINGVQTQEEVLQSAQRDVNLIFKKLQLRGDAIREIVNK